MYQEKKERNQPIEDRRIRERERVRVCVCEREREERQRPRYLHRQNLVAKLLALAEDSGKILRAHYNAT